MASACHISKLPVELFEIIFDDLILVTRQSPLALCAVCSQWRTIIHRRSRYWGTLVLRSTATVPKMKQRITLAGGEVQRLVVYGMETERFIRLAPILKPALENVDEVHFEASRQHFSHIGNTALLKCFPRILTMRGVRYATRAPSFPLGIPMMSNKLTKLYISLFDPDWNAFLGLTPSLKVLIVSDGGLPPHNVLTNIMIRLPRLKTLFLDGGIALNDWTHLDNLDLPDPVPAVLPNIRKLDVRLPSSLARGSVYWPMAPAQARQLQYLRLENCNLHWWLDSLLAPLVPPLVELYIHFPRDIFGTQDFPVHLGRTLKRFAFTDTSMPLGCLVPLVVASERLQWLDLSRTTVDCGILKRFMTPPHEVERNTTVILHGCHCLDVHGLACLKEYIDVLEVETPSSPYLWDCGVSGGTL